MKTSRLPGLAWFHWVRNLPLRVGVLTGVYLIAVMVVSVLAATRLPFLEPLALLRNLASYAAFALIALIPIASFMRRPASLFGCAVTAWGLFSVAYWVMGFFFVNLHARLRPPFNAFVVGAVVYGLVAVFSWVASMALEARSQPVIASRRRH